MAIRYVSLAYGTREEILEVVREYARPHRSAQRQAEAAMALQDLEAGDTSISIGGVTYLVEDGQS